MHFNHMLDESFQNNYQFRGVTCKSQVQESTQDGVFTGYCLDGCLSLEGESVQAGLLVRDGGIVGVAYRAGEDFHTKLFQEERFLDSLKDTISDLTDYLSRSKTIGSDDWVSVVSMGQHTAVLNDARMIIRDSTGKLMQFGCVLVETTMGTEFFTMLFGKTVDSFVVTLAKGIQSSVYQLSFEAVFSDPSEGNEVFKKIKKSKFISKKKNVIYRLEKEDFFHWFESVNDEPVLEVW